MNEKMLIFNNQERSRQLARAAKRFSDYDFLYRHVSENMAARLLDLTKNFSTILELGSRGILQPFILPAEIYIHANIQEKLLPQDGLKVICDYELIPFQELSFDLILSALELHFVNDLAGTLAQLYRCLKTDGLLLVSILGGCTLQELRYSMVEAEIAHHLACSPHIIPMATAEDLAQLMQRLGYNNVVVDSYQTCVTFKNVLTLMRDLRYMGQSNNLVSKTKQAITKKMLASIEEIYMKKYSTNNLLKATFEIITMTGMKHD